MSFFSFKPRFFNRNSKLQLYVHVARFEKQPCLKLIPYTHSQRKPFIQKITLPQTNCLTLNIYLM